MRLRGGNLILLRNPSSSGSGLPPHISPRRRRSKLRIDLSIYRDGDRGGCADLDGVAMGEMEGGVGSEPGVVEEGAVGGVEI